MRRLHSSCGYHCLAVGPLPTGEALRVAHQIEEALEAAHEKSAVHRDLSQRRSCSVVDALRTSTVQVQAPFIARLYPEQGRLVELRYFGGLPTGEAMGISPATVKRQWMVARAWLLRDLEGEAKL